MWGLPQLIEINKKHAEMGREGKPVSARQVYAECGIRTLGNSYRPTTTPEEPEVELNVESQEVTAKPEWPSGRMVMLVDTLTPEKREALRARAKLLRETDDEI